MSHHNNIKSVIFFMLLFTYSFTTFSQSIDVANAKKMFDKKNLFKLSGGINASALTYGGNDGSNRDPFNWYLQGSLNISLLGQINLPLSMNFTNAGSNFQTPTLPNRIGIHPTYKWVTAHLGDVAMSFSPYTLNGHQFTGAGFDVSPKGRFKISAMYGRLQRAVEYDSLNIASLPAYKRFGYGTKILYNTTNKKAQFGVTIFKAKDEVSSLNFKPDSLQVLPQQNLVTSFSTSLKPSQTTEFTGEYAVSALTRDVRDTTPVESKSKNLLGVLMNTKNSTGFYKALKLQFNVKIKASVVGIGYERVDPGYKTLGAYFFNNDLENITLNFSKMFLKNTINFSSNVGIQRDNLDNAKSGENKRYIFSTNLGYTPNQKTFMTLTYSNFQTYMHIKPLFQLINQVNQIQNLDTLNFSQVNQNANFNINFITKQTKSLMQNLNINISYQNAVDKASGKVKENGDTKMYNTSVSYNFSIIPKAININTCFNYSYNALGSTNFKILGPLVGLTSKLFNKKVTFGIVYSYNISSSTDVTQPKRSIASTRLNATYTFFKKHNFTLGTTHQNNKVSNGSSTNVFLGNLTYGFSF